MLKSAMESRSQEIMDAVSVDCEKEYEPEENRVVFSGCGYFSEDREDLDRAWTDFKDVNQELKDAGYRSIFDENEPPSWDSPDWQIFVKVDRYAS